MSHGSLPASLAPIVLARLCHYVITVMAGLSFLLPAGMSGAASTPSPHWAFQPLRAVDPPELRAGPVTSARSPIDRFVLHRLESARIPAANPASRATLIRRLSFDLIGLPPTPEEVDAFVSDTSPLSYERLIDGLLASPHYGERWARHWLDLARYAESDGFEHDALRPHSWRYRDYVIRSFNQDKPYDRFIREQLAGDELWPEDPEALIATGFNLLGPDMVDSADQVQRRLNVLNDMTDTAGSVFLGLTLGCARCHDHKFEPFSQRDYFGLQAFFAAAEPRRDHPVPTHLERQTHESAAAVYASQAQEELRAIQQLELPQRQRLFEIKLARLSEDARIAHRTPREQRTMEQEGTVQETTPQVQVTESEVLAALSSDERRRREELEVRLKRYPRPAKLPSAMVLQNVPGTPPPTHVLARGDYNSPMEEVKPAPPQALQHPPRQEMQGTQSASSGKGESSAAPPAKPGSGRRAALADWVASSHNPLTARVLVNRLWQHHFGRGLVATPNDFGTHGSHPSHPELLDWLAGELIRGGWRIKRVQKLILLSDTYRQSTRAREEALAGDPDNRLFSRQQRVRLEGEIVRDALLAISGRLNRGLGGPGVLPPIPSEIAKVSRSWTVSANPQDYDRRSLYILARRNLRFPFLEVFDAPDSNLSCPERGRTTTALQSLTLLNSDEVMVAASATADRLKIEAGDERARIERAYRLILAAQPTDRELELASMFLRGAPWSELCRVLFNLNSFVYVD